MSGAPSAERRTSRSGTDGSSHGPGAHGSAYASGAERPEHRPGAGRSAYAFGAGRGAHGPGTDRTPAPGDRRYGPGAAARPRGLARFLAPRAPREERCELCATPLPGERHRHLVDTERRSLACACDPCAQVLERPGAAGGRFRTVPGRYLTDSAHGIDEGAWERLGIPVGVVFLFRNSALGRTVAFYPSPAGATESELDPETWQSVLGGSLLARLLEADAEALLLRRHQGRVECHLVPIDICYELVGRMRLHWQGFDGGAEAQAELASFFAHVRERARDARRPRRSHA